MFSEKELEVMRQFAEHVDHSGKGPAVTAAMIIQLLHMVRNIGFIQTLHETGTLGQFVKDVSRMVVSLAKQANVSREDLRKALGDLIELEKIIEPNFFKR